MLGYVVRRLAIALVLVWLISVLTFAMSVRVPADPAGFILDLQHSSPAQIAKAHHILGTDKPYTTQYVKYLRRLVHGDFGMSYSTLFIANGRVQGTPVGPMAWHAFKVTGALVAGGFVLLLAVAIPLGALAAARPRSWLDRLAVGLSLAAISTHPLVVGLLLQLYAGNRWGLAPPSGYCPVVGSAQVPKPGYPGQFVTCGGVADWAAHLALPWLTFALFFVALYLRIVRTRMLEVLEEPYVQTARAKGASEAQVVRRHALRNAISPVVTMVGMDAGMAIGIALYVEVVFGLPGLGRLTLTALGNQTGIDLPVVLAVTMVAAASIIVLNLLADLVLLAVDPRIARGGRAGVVRAALGRAA